MRISDIHTGMRNVSLEGRVINMNNFMLVVDDESGRIFVRYSRRNLENQIEKGNKIKICNCQAVSYSGILQLKMGHKGYIAPI